MGATADPETPDSLSAERSERSLVIHWIRVGGWSLFAALALVLGYGVGLPDWRAITPLLTGFALATAALAVASARWRPVMLQAPATLAADVAVVLYVQLAGMTRSGASPDPAATGAAGFTVAIYLVIMMLSALSLRRLTLLVVTLTSIGCEYLLQDAAGVGPGGKASAAILFALAAFAVGYVSRRQKDLLSQMADQQRRLEARVAEQAKVIAKREVEILGAKNAALSREKIAAEEAAASKSLFLANMSHELRTPLNAVIGMTSLLVDADLTEESREQVRIIRASGEHVLALINDVLDFSKIDADKVDFEALAVSLVELVEPTLDLVGATARARDVELAYEVAPGTPVALMADPGRVRQVLLNLVSNAVKFTARGEVIVSVSATLEGNAHRFRFSVRDTGVGIPEEARARLFQAFSQADASTTRTHGGTGLGLVISARLAARMGGAVTFETEVGKGSTFHFTMLASLPVGPKANATSAPEIGGVSGPVLVVYRNQAVRDLVVRQLASWDLAARALPSLAAVAEAWRAPIAAAIILDTASVTDAELDGIDATLGPIHPPIIVVHASETRPDRRRFPWALAKPLKLSALRDALGRAFAGQNPRSTLRTMALGLTPTAVARLRILVAEDNLVNQKVAGAMLRKLGQEPTFVANGLEAVAAVARQTYDVVFMDLQMPEMDGLEATREIVRRSAGGRRPRIIGLTASALSENREACREAGMDDFVSKPVTIASLSTALSAASVRVS